MDISLSKLNYVHNMVSFQVTERIGFASSLCSFFNSLEPFDYSNRFMLAKRIKRDERGNSRSSIYSWFVKPPLSFTLKIKIHAISKRK